MLKPNDGEHMKKLPSLYTGGENIKWFGQYRKKKIGSFLKTEYTATKRPRNCFHRQSSKEMKIYSHTKTYAEIFITAPLIIFQMSDVFQ